MAEHDVRDCRDEATRRRATVALLDDIRALEEILQRGLVEKGARRIGAEQELFLVDRAMRPAPVATSVLPKLSALPFTTELARFNLEANLPPVFLGKGALFGLEESLRFLIAAADRAAGEVNCRTVLTGILPTLAISDLRVENLSPNPRYRALNDTLASFRGEPFHVRIDGLDRFEHSHDNVLFEACNTSFQLHLQVEADRFAELYNLAQAISAPLLAAATNSPVLLGHRLWRETRIALFEHATDARTDAERARRQPPRVRFGDRWVESSIVEIFREDATRFPVVVAAPESEDPFGALKAGQAPKLRALTAHNGTIWRWNRGCYGVTEGVPHLRIENRVLPSGPTVVDEVANAALFYGLMVALPAAYGRIDGRMSFDDAKRNFFTAARDGLLAQLSWVDGKTMPAHALLLEELIPHARRGLASAGLEPDEIARYLDILEARVRTKSTGADWILDGFNAIDGTNDERDRLLVSAMIERQETGAPVHLWAPLARHTLPAMDPTLERIMAPRMLTVRDSDPVELARTLMAWNKVSFIAVEDADGGAVGLVDDDALRGASGMTPVREVMRKAVQAGPELSVRAASALLGGKGVLLVVRDGRLLGSVTAAEMLKSAPCASTEQPAVSSRGAPAGRGSVSS